MRLLIKPHPLAGEIIAPPAKALAHRLLICAALADRPTPIGPAAPGEDIAATIDCLRQLGADIEENAAGYLVRPGQKPLPSPLLDCRESGTTLRLLLPLAVMLAPGARFCGSGMLPARPLTELLTALRAHGAVFSAERLPFTVGGRLTGGVYALPGHISSQYVSGLLCALPLAQEDSEITLSTPLQGAGYVELTRQALGYFGVKAAVLRIPGGQAYRSPGPLTIEGDWSGAACFLAAGALGGPVTVRGLSPASLQPDAQIIKLLLQFGARVRQNGDAITVERGELRGCDIDVSDIPDLAPILAVLGALANGTTRLYNAARLRYKESDRILNIAALLASLGGAVREEQEALSISGRPKLRGGPARCAADHRIIMAAALAATACAGDVTIAGAGAIAKSYPAFFAHYHSLGGETYDVQLG